MWTRGLTQELAREGVPREGLLKQALRQGQTVGLLEEALGEEALGDEALRDGLLEKVPRQRQAIGLLQQVAMKGSDHHLTLTPVKETFPDSLPSDPS